jgi:glycosyltransferase involved in cell wall biosynthesis
VTLDVSVVVPTCKRDESLRRCLEALLSQRLDPERFEIVVVDDGLSASTPGVIEGLRAAYPRVELRLLPGAGRGPASARNIGWRAARGTLIAFTDDDAYPAHDQWLEEGLTPFNDPRVLGVCGSVQAPAEGTPTDFQRNVMRLERGGFVTCNAFYRRSALEQVGGFDERFRRPFREDSDLHFRVEALGGLLVTNPRLIIVHPAPPGRFGSSLRLQRNSMYNALIYKKHPRRYREELQRWPPLHYYAMLTLAMAGLGSGLRGRGRLARRCAAGWSIAELAFFLYRARGTNRRPSHLLGLALTSALIPPLSIFWRLRGAVRYRVLFL